MLCAFPRISFFDSLPSVRQQKPIDAQLGQTRRRIVRQIARLRVTDADRFHPRRLRRENPSKRVLDNDAAFRFHVQQSRRQQKHLRVRLAAGNPVSVGHGVEQAGKTDLLVTWLYRLTVDRQDYSLASTIGIFVFIITAGLSLLVFNLSGSSRREEEFQ